MSYADDVAFYALDLLNASENGSENDQSLAYTRLIESDVAISDVVHKVANLMHELLASAPDTFSAAWRETLSERWANARHLAAMNLPSDDN